LIFFGIDTNGAQGHVRRSHPDQQQLVFSYKKWLQEELSNSKSKWKIVFGHHPLYTKGLNHGVIGDCLRDNSYSCWGRDSQGYGFEEVFINGKVDAYYAGHEHIFQHHIANNVNYFVWSCFGSNGILRWRRFTKKNRLGWIWK